MDSMDAVTSHEIVAVKQLQMRMKDELSPEILEDTCLLYRFLKARNFHVDKAESMFRKHLKWRKSFQVDRILEDFKPKECFLKYNAPSVIGFNKEGSLVLYFSGKVETKDLFKCIKVNDYIKNWICFIEKIFVLRKQHKEKLKELFKVTVIADLEGITLGNMIAKTTTEPALRLLRMLSDNYPELLKTIYVINAPSYFVIFYSVLKEVMSCEMRQKVQVFGHSEWQDKLLQVIDADVLPTFLGGNRTDPDGNPLCTTFVTHSGEVTEKYHLRDEERYFKAATQVTKILVSPSATKEICVDVAESGSLIRWEFLVSGKDIGFGIFFDSSELGNEQEVKEILPLQRYDTTDGTEEGCYKTQSAGKYIIVFDNTHSWISSKEVEYCINVMKPGN